MKDNTVNKRSEVEKRINCVIEQMFSDHKNCYVFYSLTSQTDNIYRIVAYIWEECHVY